LRKNVFIVLLFSIVSLVCSVTPVAADTSVGGAITANTTWTLANSPYLVTSSIQVYGTSTTAVTLTIEPGVVVKCAAGVGLQIGSGANKGALVANGTSGNRISFTRSAASGNWGSLNLQASATTAIEYADIQYSSDVYIYTSSTSIKNSTIKDIVGSYGIFFSSSANPVLENVTITTNSTYGMYLNSASPTITGGSLTNTSTTGQGINGSGSPVISNFNIAIVNGAGKYGLYLTSTLSALSVTNSTIGNSLYLGVTGVVPTITGNTFTNSDNSPLHAGANIIASIVNNNTLTGLTNAGRIEVVGEQVKQDATWIKLASPYWVTGTLSVYKDATTAVTLTISPGVTIKFASGAGIQIGSGANKGALAATGTSDNRITFTRSAASGNWSYINIQASATTAIEYADIQYSSDVYIYTSSTSIKNSTIKDIVGSYGIFFSSSANPVLENVTITTNSTYGMYLNSASPTITGGSLTNTSTTGQGINGSGSPVISNFNIAIVNGAGKYGLYLTSTLSALSVTNSTIGNSLYLGVTGVVPTITGNTFTNSDNSPLHAGANIIASIVNNNTLTGLTSAGRIEVVGEQVKQDSTWSNLAAPYWVTGTVSVYKDATMAATLTINPGVVIKFAGGAGLYIGSGANKGALTATGTSDNRITFTRSAASGNWGYINFQASATAAVEYADIQYSSDVYIYTSSTSIKNSTIKDITGSYGIYLSSANPVLENVTITSNSLYGINLTSSSPIITGGSLTNTNSTGQGIYGSGSPVISNYTVTVVNSAAKYGLYLSPTTSALSVTNSTISNSLYIGTTNITPMITSNTFTNGDSAPLHAGANIIASIINNNTLTGLTSAGRIEVVGEQVKQDATWSKLAAPYWVSGTVAVYKDATTAATLTINPGVVVKFAAWAGMQTGNGGTSKGSLITRGTSSDRITFTRSAASGNWGNINFLGGTLATSAIEYTDIQYSADISIYSSSPSIKSSTIKDIVGTFGLYLSTANPVLENVTITTNSTYGMTLTSSSPIITGGSLTNTNATGQGIYGYGSPVISNYSVSIANNAGKYGLYFTGASSALSVTNSTIANGLYLGAGGFIPTITGNTFSNCDTSPPHAGANIIGQIMDNNSFTSLTSTGKIEVVAEQVSRDVQWKKFAAPYVVLGSIDICKDTSAPSTLTIDPGVTVKFALNTALNIGSGASKGVLAANGTATLPITFTSSQAIPAAGNWSGIKFISDAASASVLTNIIVEYGGSGGAYSSANITFNSSSPTLRNATIRNSAGSGIYMTSATNTPKIYDSTITANQWGVYSTNSNPLISNAKILGNSTAGIWNSSTTVDVDARGNWWGTASGPAHASNPSGAGNAVSNKVLFNPWLSQTPGVLNISTVSFTPATFNPAGDSLTISAAISAFASWTITITDSTTAQVKVFTGSGTAISQPWSGENSSGVKVADGIYTIKIEATDASYNTAVPIAGTITVSRLIPIAIINAPADNLMFPGGATIDIYATASDTTDFKNYILEYGTGDSPVSWNTLFGPSTAQPTNAKIYSWNTSGFTSGTYSLRLTATDNAGNSQSKTVRVRLLWITSNAQTENYISPNNDGLKDSSLISATSNRIVNWNIAVANSGSAVVRTLTTANATTLSQAWNGTDTAGMVVPDGAYTYTIIATDPASGVQSAPKTGTIISDITAPTVTITSPAPGGLLRNSVIVTGTASDANITSYTLDYGPAAGTGPWTAINSGTASVSSATLGTWITNDQGGTIALANGNYALRLMATDKAGNSTGFVIPVTADNLTLSNITASSHAINTASAEISTISFSINAPATVTFKIIPEKLGVNGTPVYQSSKVLTEAGSGSFIWDGKDGSAMVVPDEAYIYVLNATDGTRTDSYAPVASSNTGTVTCTQGMYKPRMNFPLTISYSVAQPERVDIKISWGSQNFKIMDGVPHVPGTYTFNWDGRNPANVILDGGGVAHCSYPSLMAENFILTSGNTPLIGYVKTDPYQIQLSYGQFTRVKYAISKQAIVTIAIISSAGNGITLVDNLLQAAGDYEIEWNGVDPADLTAKGFVVNFEDDYVVWVQAIDPVTGASTTRRGSLTASN
jgi:flagellar hook assembly protein FlgD/general stress protein 26